MCWVCKGQVKSLFAVVHKHAPDFAHKRTCIGIDAGLEWHLTELSNEGGDVPKVIVL